MKSDFHERRQARKEKYEELSVKNEKESTNRYKAAKGIGDHIPFGQPILVGHHSEKRHRRDLERIDNNMRKSVEADRKAEHYAEKAKHIENDRSIYSDDPEAIRKLKEKIDDLESAQKTMKDANRIVKSKKMSDVEKVEKLVELGFKEDKAQELLIPVYGRVGFPSYSLQNNNANINRNKKRLKELERKEQDETTEKIVNGVKVVDNVEDNRLQLFFDDIPAEEIRKALKGNGFRWSRYLGCWQRHRSNDANWAANRILKMLDNE